VLGLGELVFRLVAGVAFRSVSRLDRGHRIGQRSADGAPPARTNRDNSQVSVRVLRANDRVAVPWRNGAGSTREVAVGGADESGFDWRVSLADIDRDGPFSSYDGYTRVMTLVQGDGLELILDGVPHRVERRNEPFAFDGGTPAMCRLFSGPVLALNVIGRRASGVEVIRPTGTTRIDATGAVVAVLLDGAARLSADFEGTADLPTTDADELGGYDAVLIDRADDETGSLCLAPSVVGTVVAVVRIGQAADRPSSSRLRW